MLFLVATPIGNLGDISERAIATLQEADLILCEDTRHSRSLLDKFKITTPLQSYHKFNEAEREGAIVERLKSGERIALISDAGTPGIRDPGERLVDRCHKEGITVQAIPGAVAAICALVSSGLPTEPFQFIGFLEKKPGALRRQLVSGLHYTGTTIAYESPNRLVKTLKLLSELQPDCQVAIGRELTKRYEEVVRGTAASLYEEWKERAVKGEVVLLFYPSQEGWDALTPEEHLSQVEKELGLQRKEAIKLVAELRGIGKRELYLKKETT